jgi:hypothetical protein
MRCCNQTEQSGKLKRIGASAEKEMGEDPGREEIDLFFLGLFH